MGQGLLPGESQGEREKLEREWSTWLDDNAVWWWVLQSMLACFLLQLGLDFPSGLPWEPEFVLTLSSSSA